MLNKNLLLHFVLIVSVSAFAHEGHHHEPHGSIDKKVGVPDLERQIFEQINARYNAIIKPIFQTKCMTCHSLRTAYPFYYKWPIARQLIDHDIEEAKKHIGMDSGFPFSGHGTPTEDLEAIKKSTEEGSMPPWRYRTMHLGSGLTEDEKKLITQWVKDSQKLIHKM